MAARTTYNEQTARQLAEQVAEWLRGMNHLTREAGSLQTPMEVHQVLGELARAASRLPQLLSQLDDLLTGWTEDGLITIDGGEFSGDPAAAVATASLYLTERASAAAALLSDELDRAQQAIAYASRLDDLPDEA